MLRNIYIIFLNSTLSYEIRCHPGHAGVHYRPGVVGLDEENVNVEGGENREAQGNRQQEEESTAMSACNLLFIVTQAVLQHGEAFDLSLTSLTCMSDMSVPRWPREAKVRDTTKAMLQVVMGGAKPCQFAEQGFLFLFSGKPDMHFCCILDKSIAVKSVVKKNIFKPYRRRAMKS